MNKKFFLGALALVMLAGCGNANTGVDEEGAAASDAATTEDAKTTTAEIEHDGATTKAEVTKEGDKVPLYPLTKSTKKVCPRKISVMTTA